MKFNAISRILMELNLSVVYTIAVALTLIVVLHRTGVFIVPRAMALLSWYLVLFAAACWAFFHIIYLLAGDARDIGLASVVQLLTFVPVYVCALIVVFMYPKKEREKSTRKNSTAF